MLMLFVAVPVIVRRLSIDWVEKFGTSCDPAADGISKLKSPASIPAIPKQYSIEGALEELNDMINQYNSICSMQKEK